MALLDANLRGIASNRPRVDVRFVTRQLARATRAPARCTKILEVILRRSVADDEVAFVASGDFRDQVREIA
jgi:hypothetical protein